MHKVFVACLVLAFLTSPLHADSEFNKPVRVAPGVWFVLRDSHNNGLCNNIIIEMKDYLIVVDANYPAGARLTMEEVKALSPKPVKYVFNTHHHSDHLYGNPIWTRAGATTFAYAGVIEELNRYEPGEWNLAVKSRPDVAELKSGPEPPQQTFRENLYVLQDSTRRVEFRHLGWGHTRGDALVYLPKEKILCTGDAAVNGHFANLDESNIWEWPKVLARMEKFNVRMVLPGHGPAGGKEILSGQRQFLLSLTQAVQQAIDQGKTLDDLVTKATPPVVNLQLPESVWIGHGLPRQVAAVYGQLKRGKPGPVTP